MTKSILYFICTILGLLTLTGSSSLPERDPFHKSTSMVVNQTSSAINSLRVVDKKSGKLSLNFQEMPVTDLLELLTEFKGINLLLSDGIKGRITVHLNNVTWDQALATVLTMQGLGQHQQEGILWIAPATEMAKQQNVSLTDPNSELMTLKYAKAADIASLLQNPQAELLSPNGHVIADTRTNTLWVKDNSQHLKDIQQFLRSVDVPVKQVLITARIVNMDTDSVAELGLKFGTASASSLNSDQALHRDMPPFTVEEVGHFTVAIAKLAENTLLDLELSALEREGHAEIISNPELVTANRQPASIESGQEIPYQEKTSSGATNIAFKKAVLSLEVTPEITPDNRIWLNLIVHQDKISAVSIEGVPAISTQQMKTQLLVNNGETIVLGGIYEEGKSRSKERIPFWGSIPVLGSLFTHKETHAERKELLIFVSPQVLH